MKYLFAILLLCLVVSPCLCANVGPSFNVVDYGAKGNGQTDDSQAFVKAWQHVCKNATRQSTPTLVIPKGKIFMLQPVSFVGPCKPATVNIQLQGTIVAPNSVGAWKWPTNDKSRWVQFSDINGLVISGGGKLDARGAPWWNLKVTDRPTALYLHNCQNLKLSGLTHLNSARNHIGVNVCSGSLISNIHIIAPANSPNTDGIDISASTHVTVQNSIIETGDDCIAINSGSSFINISGVNCGPGHGISVGSLGNDGDFDTVEEVHVQHCTFSGTTNGARIKTWVGGSGYARKITFENIQLINAKNPLIIDQQYRDIDRGSLIDQQYRDVGSGSQAVNVSDVTYRNVTGTSASAVAIELSCDPIVGCTGIVMERINITSANGQKLSATCTKAHGTCSSCIPSVPCLSNLGVTLNI